MIRALLFTWVTLAIAIAVAAAIIPSVEVDGGFFGLFGVSLVFGLVNAILGPILRIVSLPLTLITLGLFSLVVNAVLVAITAGLADNLNVGGFFPALLAAIVISVVSTLLGFILVRQGD